MSKFLKFHHEKSPAIVQYPIVLVSSGFDGSSTPADVLYLYIHFTSLYLSCFLHAVIYFVHCTLSLIVLSYMCML